MTEQVDWEELAEDKWESLTKDEQAAFTIGITSFLRDETIEILIDNNPQWDATDTRGYWMVVGWNMAQQQMFSQQFVCSDCGVAWEPDSKAIHKPGCRKWTADV